MTRVSNKVLAKYRKEKMREYRIRLAKSTHADVINKLDNVTNKTAYIVGLVRDDINNN